VKAIDSNLLVYASLADHPAMAACEQYITGYPVWVTNIVNLVELQRVLVAVYGVSENDADSKLTDLCKALVVDDLTAAVAVAALSLRQSCGVDFNDAVLLEIARHRGVTVLATDDSQLAIAALHNHEPL
jgi:predicted nucleic acid-binding protein